MTAASKSGRGRFFEDFHVGDIIRHATPRTITHGDVALYTALYGSRFALQSSDELARALGHPLAPIDDMLVFHVVFGKSVPDVSINAVANLGYAECRFKAPVYPGDTISAHSEVIGIRQSSAGDTGIVYVRTTGLNQNGDTVLEYARWVMVRKRDQASKAPEPVVPTLEPHVEAQSFGDVILPIPPRSIDPAETGSPHAWEDYSAGERIDHRDGMTIEESEHQLATRLYQNTAKVHFDAHAEATGRFGRRIVYGGVVMSLARALSFNGLGNAFHITAINAGRHAAPCFAGDTIYAASEILETSAIPGRSDIGALRTRMKATKQPPGASPQTPPTLVLDLDIWLVIPTRASLVL